MKPIRRVRHSPAGEGGSLTVPTAHGPPHAASGRRLGSRLSIIKPVKNTSQTASELQTAMCAQCFHSYQSSQPPSRDLISGNVGNGVEIRGTAQCICTSIPSQNSTQHRAQSWACRAEREVSLAPGIAKRTVDAKALSSSSTVLLLWRPGVRRGIRFLGDKSRFTTTSLRVLCWLQHLGRRPERQLRSPAVILQ